MKTEEKILKLRSMMIYVCETKSLMGEKKRNTNRTRKTTITVYYATTYIYECILLMYNLIIRTTEKLITITTEDNYNSTTYFKCISLGKISKFCLVAT